jgi:FixJ family two-component response regulator
MMIAQNTCSSALGDDDIVTPLATGQLALLTTESTEASAVPSLAPTVFVIDPDQVTLTTVRDLLHGYRISVEGYTLGRDFFAAYTEDRPGCLVLEQRVFDMSGLQIQRRLAKQNQRLPMVFVSSALDVATAVALMRGGALHVLEKPLRSIELLTSIQEAVAMDRNERREAQKRRRVRESIAKLTYKERQLVSLVASAKSTKAIASELRICSRAVELRRRGVMQKLGMKSSLELLRFAILAWQDCTSALEMAESKPALESCPPD